MSKLATSLRLIAQGKTISSTSVLVLDQAAKKLVEYERALNASVRLQSHYAELLNGYDQGTRLQFATADEWLKRLEMLDR